MIPLIFPLLIGSLFDMLSEMKFGFYFVPALTMSLLFYFLPFVFVWLNIAIAYITSFALALSWSYFLTGMNFPSPKFVLHILAYLIIIAGALYLINVLQKK